MNNRANAVAAVATLAVLDALRRKDLYLMAILCGLMIAAGRLFAALGVWGLETFVKDVTFTAVSLCSVLLCILLAARQVPEEISRRTLYPLLARPIGRGELLLGKFLGTVLMSWVALLMAALVAFLSLVSLHFSLGRSSGSTCCCAPWPSCRSRRWRSVSRSTSRRPRRCW
jgi:ABC-type transport system involved in multi-copper enzyme maturation permease subunit